jgi:flagellar hook-length control protein FliK
VTALPEATTQDAPGQEASPAPVAQMSPVQTTATAAAPAAQQTDDPQPAGPQPATPAMQTAPATAPAVDNTARQPATATQPDSTVADAARPAPQGPAQPAATATHTAAAGKHPATAGGQQEHQQGQERHQPRPGATAEATVASTHRIRRGRAHRPQPIVSTRTQQPMSPTPATAEGAAPASETGAPTHAAATAPAGRVRILELAESMRAVVSVANRRGSTTARIMLRPDTLGGVQVKLRAGRDGVSAELIADSAHAAQALATAGGDLRRALEAQGVNLLGLDVRTAGDGAEAHGHEGRRAAESEQRGAQGGMDAGEDPEITIESSRLPDPGSQVDVLA